MVRRNRSSRSGRSSGPAIQQLPWREICNRSAATAVLGAGQVETIHTASLDLLENHGMRILHAGARELLSAAGADVDQQEMMVRFDRGLVLEKLAQAPRETTLKSVDSLLNSLSSVKTGRPLGSEKFIETLESLTGRPLKRRKPGRKPFK